MRSRSGARAVGEGFITQRRIYTLLAAFALVASATLLFAAVARSDSGSLGHLGSGTGSTSRNSKVDKVLIEDIDIPTNSRFKVSKTSNLYTVNATPKCWLDNCRSRNNKRVYRACSGDSADPASEWNVLGARAMERFVDGDLKSPSEFSQRLLAEARNYFQKAVEANPKCKQAILNLALVETRMGQAAEANKLYEQAAEMFKGEVKDEALVHLFWGFNIEKSGDRSGAITHYDRVRELDKDTERQWWGIAITNFDRTELRHPGTTQVYGPLLDFITYKYFSKTPISQYALLEPGTQDWFIQENWIALRKVLPPFVLSALQKCYRDLIDQGQLPFGDTQAKRYTTYNDRCGRFVHYQLTDLIGTVIAHNPKPSYTYFGGYKGPGSELAPHNDREQCEFTMSLTIDQHPVDQGWALAAKDHHGKEVSAELMPGDGFLFMGRVLVHYRKGALPEGRWVNQIFLHYVNEKFDKTLN